MHRLTHRVIDQRWTSDGFALRTRVGPAATDIAMLATYHWTADGDALVLRVTVEELQTPYVYPQENGNRVGVRWVQLRGPANGVRIEGDPTFDLTVRRWTSEDLDAARHTSDLRPRDKVFVNLDLAQTGLGTASCGPGVLPQYELHAAPTNWTVRLMPDSGHGV